MLEVGWRAIHPFQYAVWKALVAEVLKKSEGE